MRSLVFLPFLPLILSSAIETRKKGDGGYPTNPSVTIHPYNSPYYEDGIVITGVQDEDNKVDKYYGIPYAEPPVGFLRWRRPIPYNYSDPEVDARHPAPSCLQDISQGEAGPAGTSEDCLFLNVYKPSDHWDTDDPLPVIVYLHSGGWQYGSGIVHDPTGLVSYSQTLNKPVVFVTLNYRLGVLGWPNGPAFDHARAGNLGMRDVIRALEWVQENIRGFGGDRHKVTLHGHSAGAITISHLYFDTEQSLFNAAIMSSGAPSSVPIGLTEKTWLGPYEQLLNITKCDNVTFGTEVGCLRNVSAADIFAAQQIILSNPNYTSSFVYGPSVDSDLIPDQPWKLLEKGIIAPIPFIIGQTKDEATGATPVNITQATLVEDFDKLYPVSPPANFTTNLTTLYPPNPVRGAPFGTGNATFGLDPTYKQFAALLTDARHTAPRRHMLRQANEYFYNRTWTYTFDYVKGNASTDRYGAVHLSDLPYIFGDNNNNSWTQPEKDLSKLIQGYWLNFTYFANPNGPNASNPFIYPDPYVNTTAPVVPPAPGTPVNTTYWTEHDLLIGRKDILKLIAGNATLVQDNYREGSNSYLNGHPVELGY
ncbi:uncharacterized protein I206_102081 [Kwoniella pini CBS 10737]|uniref:Carboxylic ester hydrolase n=1 Tax=Kwoniella pini CBS 10737 TaxID=1296096 RepID=A0A1B9HUV5_9TREE|nr:uncharacterized protein I206_06826 [Kwoniella pini CBS 10737]OCF47052.1 hypothetical protein I206_06826 [Kwoniella pini CBS 10737]